MNANCYTALGKARPHNKDKKELLVSCLFPRAMELFQGIYLLIRRGMIPSSNVMLRVLIENMFVLVAITKDDEALEAYILNDEAERLKVSNKVICDKDSAILGIPIEDAKRIKAEIEEDHKKRCKEKEEEVDKKKLRAWSTMEFAQRAGLYEWYLTAYAHTSGAVHSGIKDVEPYLNLDEAKKEVKSLNFIPTDKGTLRIVTAACSSLNMALYAFLTALDLDTKVCNVHAELLNPFIEIASASEEEN